MKMLISFLATIIAIPLVISLLVCMVGWIFMTDFLIFDILLGLALLALQIIIPIVVLIIIIWAILELVNIINC
jgi:hypothetical protein